MFRARLPSISSHLTKCHACHWICTLSPLDAALTMRFAKNTQHNTSEVLRLARKMTMDTSTVLRLPRKQHIFWKRRKHIAPATQNDFRHITKHVWTPRSAKPATRNEATPHVKRPKVTPFVELTIGTAIRGLRGRMRTVADGCKHKRGVEQTHPQPPDPQSETGTLATHSGKTKKIEKKSAPHSIWQTCVYIERWNMLNMVTWWFAARSEL